ncbi:MAG: hypothetical protein UV75_C0015G0007 [Candidatus Giovannonibacteria bacterium GW2011_GWA1_43_15]|nr:MAG: hypothetical protein UV75_C0015G0007 [Candidatus Giovannonibacteria bacterium GW2011_GWA1_43_15]KKT21241.1 MAG: hypothetical protein UW05_C0014G0011 [Candidatus Giovannonibacteria bacterium GW2011_GWC2_43_8]OGF71891.1 MAG: hypothetical protein A3E35_00540 [Candidatus Giovannonibacteria bacterium RIFCSPHIGHO2_12_FULL_44_22]
MSLLNKHFWKFFAGLLAIVVLGFLVIYGADFYNNPRILRDWLEARKTQKQYEDLKKLYEADTYGGKTPEETLALFIDALKKGDTDLAAKYVFIDDQENVRADLLQAKTTGNLNKVIERFLSLRKSKLNEDEAWFVITDENRVIKYEILLGKNQKGLWKILEL